MSDEHLSWLRLTNVDLQDLINKVTQSTFVDTQSFEISPEDSKWIKNHKLPSEIKAHQVRTLIESHFGCTYTKQKKGDNVKVLHEASGIAFSVGMSLSECSILFVKKLVEKLGYTKTDVALAWNRLTNGTNGASKKIVFKVRLISTKKGFGYEAFSVAGLPMGNHAPKFSTEYEALLSVQNQWGLKDNVRIETYLAPEGEEKTLRLDKVSTFGRVKVEY
jgi:hypothetical protein